MQLLLRWVRYNVLFNYCLKDLLVYLSFNETFTPYPINFHGLDSSNYLHDACIEQLYFIICDQWQDVDNFHLCDFCRLKNKYSFTLNKSLICVIHSHHIFWFDIFSIYSVIMFVFLVFTFVPWTGIILYFTYKWLHIVFYKTFILMKC